MSLTSNWKPLAPKTPGLETNGASPGGGVSRDEMFHKCLVCSKQVRAPRNMVMVHCADCDGRLSTYKNVFSSVEKVRTPESPPKVVTTGLGLNPNLYRKASELRLGNAGATEHVDVLGFGEMDWNSVGLIDRPLLSESLMDEDLTPRHVSRPGTEIETPTPTTSSACSATKVTAGVTIKTSTNAKGSLMNPKKIIVIKNAAGVQEILEESATGKYVKCSDPLKLKKCIEASGTNNGVKVVKVGQQRLPQGTQPAKSLTMKVGPQRAQPAHRPRLIAPKPPSSSGFPAAPAKMMIPPGISLVPQAPVSAASPSRFVLSMPITASSQVFQQKPPVQLAPAPSRPTSSKTITEACGSISCPICPKSFWKRNALNDHITTSHKNSRAFPCGHCNVSFTLLINLVNHKLQVHPHLIQFLCRSCGLETHDRNLFNKHVSPNFVAAFDCSCGEQFKTAALLQAHQKVTNHLSRNVPQVKNVIANVKSVAARAATATAASTKAIPAPAARKSEIETDSQKKLIPEKDLGLVPNGSIKCPTCVRPVYFAHAKYLDLHVELRHSGEKVLPCQFCQLKFSHLLELVSHKTNTHPKLSKWTCKLCGVSFSHLNESEYCSHLNTHSIVTNDCRCGKQFATEDELEEHGRTTHPDVTRFKCFEKRIQEFPSTSMSPGPESGNEPGTEPAKSAKTAKSQQVTKTAEAPKPKPPPSPASPKINLPSPSSPVRATTAVKEQISPKKGKDAKKPVSKASATRTPAQAVVKTYGHRQPPTKAVSPGNEELQEKEKSTATAKEKKSPRKASSSPRSRSAQSPQTPSKAQSKASKVTVSPPGRKNDNKAKAVKAAKVLEKPPLPKKAEVATPPKRKRGAESEPTESPASPAKKARSQAASAKSESPAKSETKQSSRAAAAAAESSVRRSGRERRPKKIE